jgi:hypothetical protein
MPHRTKLRNPTVLVCLLLFTHVAICSGPFRVRVVDATDGSRIEDPVVTVGDRILVASADDKEYEVPADAEILKVRASGYRAASFAVSEARQREGILALAPFSVHALYLTEYGISSPPLRQSALDIIRLGNANAVVVNIKSDRGFIPYPSQIPLATTVGARRITTIRSLADLVKSLHDQHVYVIGRIVTFKDEPLATARPELAIHTANGALFHDREHLAWTDPFKPEVRAYNIAVAIEAAQAGFDEVQFDYVRFPDCANKLILSCPVSEASRTKAISAFLTEARQALVRFNVFESVDIFGYVAWNRNDTGIGQRLEDITQIVDYVCPMLYPSGFQFGVPGHRNPVATDADIHDTIKLTLDEIQRRTHANPKNVRPWLQAFRDYAFNRRVFGPNEIQIQIRAASAAGSDSWSLWNPRNVYDNTGLITRQSRSKNDIASGAQTR